LRDGERAARSSSLLRKSTKLATGKVRPSVPTCRSAGRQKKTSDFNPIRNKKGGQNKK
jgi:hypothetical protein